jgi:hypothetical protein
MIMEIYHFAMCQRIKEWTITKTAEQFGCSVGLVSENIRLATAIHLNENLLRCETRQDALKKLGNGKKNGH